MRLAYSPHQGWELTPPQAPRRPGGHSVPSMDAVQQPARVSLNCQLGFHRVLSNLARVLVPSSRLLAKFCKSFSWAMKGLSVLQQETGASLSVPCRVFQAAALAPLECGPAGAEGGSQQTPPAASSWQYRQNGLPESNLFLKIC